MAKTTSQRKAPKTTKTVAPKTAAPKSAKSAAPAKLPKVITAAIAAALAAATSADWRDRGLMHVQSEAFRPAYDDLARSLSGDPSELSASPAFW